MATVAVLLLAVGCDLLTPSAEEVVAAGDIASCRTEADEATAELLEGIDGTVLALGDNAYPRGTAEDFEECYGPSWGRFKGRTKPVPGNHEYYTQGARDYFEYFGEAAGEPEEGYYSYELGSWHVVALNSNCEEVRCGRLQRRGAADRVLSGTGPTPEGTSGAPGGQQQGSRQPFLYSSSDSPSLYRFVWRDHLEEFRSFNATPGEEPSRYLSTVEKPQIGHRQVYPGVPGTPLSRLSSGRSSVVGGLAKRKESVFSTDPSTSGPSSRRAARRESLFRAVVRPKRAGEPVLRP